MSAAARRSSRCASCLRPIDRDGCSSKPRSPTAPATGGPRAGTSPGADCVQFPRQGENTVAQIRRNGVLLEGATDRGGEVEGGEYRLAAIAHGRIRVGKGDAAIEGGEAGAQQVQTDAARLGRLANLPLGQPAGEDRAQFQAGAMHAGLDGRHLADRGWRQSPPAGARQYPPGAAVPEKPPAEPRVRVPRAPGTRCAAGRRAGSLKARRGPEPSLPSAAATRRTLRGAWARRTACGAAGDRRGGRWHRATAGGSPDPAAGRSPGRR